MYEDEVKINGNLTFVLVFFKWKEYASDNDSDSDYKADYSSKEESNLNEVIQNILETSLKDMEGISSFTKNLLDEADV